MVSKTVWVLTDMEPFGVLNASDTAGKEPRELTKLLNVTCCCAPARFLGRFSNLKQHLEPFEIPSVYEKNKRTAYLVG